MTFQTVFSGITRFFRFRLNIRFPKDKRLVILCMTIVALLLLSAIFANIVAPYDPYEPSLIERNQPPGSTHLLGTDPLGRDTLSRTVFALRTSIGIALIGVIGGTVIGTLMGMLAGFFRGWPDRIISALIDFFYAIPNLLILLAGIAVLGTKTWVLILFIAFAGWHGTARLIRGQVLSIRERQSVKAAIALGSSNARLIFKHILPNLVSILMVSMTMKLPGMILMESSLSFLGLGVQPPLASLGAMVGEGRDYLINAPYIAMSPALVIALLVICFQVIGDYFRDEADIKAVD